MVQSLVSHSFSLRSIFIHAFLLDRTNFGSKDFHWQVGVLISPLEVMSDFWRWNMEVPYSNCWSLA